jgi:DNA primase
MAGPVFDEIGADAYAHPVYAQIRQVITEAGGVVSASAGAAWVERLRSLAPHEVTQSVISELAVEPFHAGGDGEPDARYVAGNLVALRLRLVDRSIAEIKSKLQRTNPLEEEDQHRRLFGDLVTREAYRRRLMASASGEQPDGA